MRKRVVLPVAGLCGIVLVLVGSYERLVVSEQAGSWIAALGALGVLATVVATVAAILSRRSPSRRPHVTALALGLLSVAMIVPAVALWAWAVTADGRYQDRLDDFPVDYARSAVTGGDLYSVESEYVAAAWKVDDPQACVVVRKALDDWWDAGSVQRQRGEGCVYTASSSGSEARAVIEGGRLVVSMWSRTDDLFVF